MVVRCQTRLPGAIGLLQAVPGVMSTEGRLSTRLESCLALASLAFRWIVTNVAESRRMQGEHAFALGGLVDRRHSNWGGSQQESRKPNGARRGHGSRARPAHNPSPRSPRELRLDARRRAIRS